MDAALRGLAAFLLWGWPVYCWATVYELRADGAELFGSVEQVVTRYEDTLIEIARSHSLGFEELVRVNPGVDPWLPGEGTTIMLPSQRLLPPGPRTGIVINLPEHRLYYYLPVKRGETPRVMTFPVSIGKMDWQTPLGETRIRDKRKDPAWYPPESVRAEHAARGDILPKVVPAGPDNPLGAFAMRLAIPGGAYLIHGTNNPAAVGMAVTHGCIRMYPEDIAALFPLVKVGTPVTLINEPLKIARIDGEVWLEVHPPVDAEGQTHEPDLDAFSTRLEQVLGATEAAVHWDFALLALRAALGVPTIIGLELLPEPAEMPASPDPGEPPAAPAAPAAL